jgi:hypothetical protein
MQFRTRLERLEARLGPKRSRVFRYGYLTRLADDFAGERHVVIVRREPAGSPNVEWCEFEERPRRGPNEVDDSFTVYLSREQMNGARRCH